MLRTDTLALAEELERCNANLASLSENLDTSSAMGRMFFKLMSVLAEFERDQLSERTTNAMTHLRKHNRRISSRIPFGYTLSADGETLLPVASEQAAIQTMATRRNAGMTLGGIARSMEAAGVATKQGGKWTPKTILAILRRQEKLAA